MWCSTILCQQVAMPHTVLERPESCEAGTPQHRWRALLYPSSSGCNRREEMRAKDKMRWIIIIYTWKIYVTTLTVVTIYIPYRKKLYQNVPMQGKKLLFLAGSVSKKEMYVWCTKYNKQLSKPVTCHIGTFAQMKIFGWLRWQSCCRGFDGICAFSVFI